MSDNDSDIILELEKIIEKQKAQIEKMKCCGNCKYWLTGEDICKPIAITGNKICEKWELYE